MRQRKKPPAQVVHFVGPEKPPKYGDESWGVRLAPLINHPGEWAAVRVYERPEQAQSAQGNLTKRHDLGLQIPMGDGDWEFASRDCTLYAIYRGAKKRVVRKKNASKRVR